ncbi:MAG: hypothetical protein QXW80_02325 [Candidatus Micrarchaeia archaeon]
MESTKNKFALFFILLISGIYFSINVEDYLSVSESPLSVVQQNFTSGSNIYTIVTIASKDSMVLKNGQIVKSLDEIKEALKIKCFDTSYPSKSNLESIKEKVLAFNASRNIKTSLGNLEEFCDSITGQAEGDEGGCVDLVSCQIACNKGSYACFQYGAGSAQFLPTLLEYANIKRGIDSNLSLILSNINQLDSISTPAQINFQLSSKLKEISDSILLLQDLATSYVNNKLFTRPTFNFCIPVGYTMSLNTSALSSAASIASQLRSNAACFDNIDSNAQSIYNETFRRIELYTSTKAKANLQKEFDSISTRYNYLLDKATNILGVVEDSNLNDYISNIDSLNQQFYSNLNRNEIDQAGYVISVIKTKLDEMDNYMSTTYSAFDQLSVNKERVAKLLEKASVIITPSDTVFYSELTSLNNEYLNLNKKLSGKLVYEEISNYANRYGKLADDLDSLIKRKKETATETVSSALASPLNSLAVGILDAASAPLGIKEEEKRLWAQNIPLIVIVGMDIIVLAIFGLAFFFLVLRNTSVFGKAKIMNTWILIFAAVIILLALLSYALYIGISNEISSTSIYNFISAAEKNGKVYLFVEYLSEHNSTSIKSCADKIAAQFYGKGIEVEQIDVVDGICKDRLLSECMAETDKIPLIQLSYSNETQTKFYTFYRAEGIIQGTESYFEKCNIAEFIE